MQALLMTTNTSILGKHEALFWNDGKLELEQIADGQDADHVFERVLLDEIEQYRLYLLLEAKFRAKEMQP